MDDPNRLYEGTQGCEACASNVAAGRHPFTGRPLARAFVVLTLRDTPCGLLVEGLRAYGEEHPTMTGSPLQTHQLVLHKATGQDFAAATAACEGWISNNYGANRIRKALADRESRVSGSERDRCMFEGVEGTRGRRRGR